MNDGGVCNNLRSANHLRLYETPGQPSRQCCQSGDQAVDGLYPALLGVHLWHPRDSVNSSIGCIYVYIVKPTVNSA